MIWIFLASFIIFIELLDDRHWLSPELSTFFSWCSRLSSEWESLISVTAVSLSSLSQLSRSRDVSHVSHLCLAKYFHHRMCAGACLGVGIPPGNVGGDWRGSGAAIYWILEIMGLRSVWEHIGVVSRGWGQHRSDIRPSSSHPSHPWARPGSVLFCIIIIIIITRLSHRPASSAGVTGPREPVPKQYQENKSEDQL